MNCPICQHAESMVIRTDREASAIRRRRECTCCHHRWNTFETSQDAVSNLQKMKELLAPVVALVK